MTKNEILYRNAERAIDQLHTDTSVSKEETRESLRNLREHIEMLIEATK